VFSQLSIENVTKIRYDPSRINQNAKKSIGVDAGFGSSKFAIVVIQFVEGKIQVIFAEEYERPNFQAMINRISRLGEYLRLGSPLGKSCDFKATWSGYREI
jgi:hypothetical protein